MDLHYKQEVTVGTLVVVGVGLFLVGTMWLKGRSFSTAPEVQVEFADVGTLKRGSSVKVSGVSLGTVERIEFQEVGRVLVTMSLDGKVRPKIDASAKLGTVGLVAADAVIFFDPGRSTEPLPQGKVLIGTVEQGLSTLGTDLGNQAKEVMTSVQEIANKRLADDLHQTLTSLNRALDLYADARKGPTADLTETMRSLQKVSARLDSTLAQAKVDATLRKSDTLITNLTGTSKQFTTTTATLDTLLQRLNRGDGTLGKMMRDSLLYGDMRRVTKSLQELIDTLKKHPGKITIQVKVF